MKILVTGASGFIGKNLIYYLSKTNNKIFAQYNTQKPQFKPKNIEYIKFNLLNKSYKVLEELKPEIIFHLAWSKIPNFSYKNSLENLNSSKLLFDKIASIKSCKKIIVAGSCFEKYKLSKNNKKEEIKHFIWAKNSLKNYLLNNCAKKKVIVGWFRFFFIYGKGQRSKSLIPTLIKHFKEDINPNLNNPLNKNDFIHIEDVCSVLVKSINTEFKSGTFDVGSGKLTSIYEISRILEKKIRKKKTFTDTYEKLTQKNLQNEKIVANNKLTKKIFNWSIKNTISKGLNKTLNDYNKNSF